MSRAPRNDGVEFRFIVREGADSALNRINALDFAGANGLNEEQATGAFLHAARLGIFDLSWNVLCPGCGGVLNEGATLKTINRDEYGCALCAAGYKPTLDEMGPGTESKIYQPRSMTESMPNALPPRSGAAKRGGASSSPGSGSKIIQPTNSRESGPEFGPAPRSSGGAPGHRGGWKKR